MELRRLGKTGFNISPISLGTWQVGGRWGEPFDDALAERIIEAAIENHAGKGFRTSDISSLSNVNEQRILADIEWFKTGQTELFFNLRNDTWRKAGNTLRNCRNMRG